MKRKAIAGLLAGLLIGVPLAYYVWFSPSACARRINIEMNKTPVSEKCSRLLRQLAQTVGNPTDYIRYYPPEEHHGWIKSDNLVLARRLLSDRATELLPGIIAILRDTPPGSQDRDRDGALTGLLQLRSHAAPALPELLKAVQEDRHRLSDALRCIQLLGTPAPEAVPVLVSTMARTDLTYLEVDDAQYTLASIRGIRDQDKQFIRPLLSNRDLGKRWAGAIVLGQTGDPAAVGTLTELLDQDIPLDRKEQIVKTMQEIQYLPTDVLDLLRKKQKAAASRGDWYAAWIMQYRDQPRWAQERTNAVNSPGSPREP